MGVNALAREAGFDKVLIYRYFGDLDGVYRAFAAQSDFWWTLGEMQSGIELGTVLAGRHHQIVAAPARRRAARQAGDPGGACSRTRRQNASRDRS